MNTAAFTALASSLRVFVVGRAGYIGSYRVKHLLRRGCDAVTFDNPSTSCHGPQRKGEYRLPGNLADQVDPVVTSALHLPLTTNPVLLTARPLSPDIPMLTIAKNLYDYRELMATLAWKNVTLRYKQVYLGIARARTGCLTTFARVPLAPPIG